MSEERIAIEIVMKALRSVADGIRWNVCLTAPEVIEALQGAAADLEEQLRKIDDEENVR